MRFLPTRIVLAALAFVVGAVLALPMLLSRKAEAGDAPPKLEADAGAAWLLAADSDATAARGVEATERGCGDALDGDGTQAYLAEAVATPLGTATDFADGRLLGPTLRRSVAVPNLASPPQPPWPAPQTFDRQRKYHLRP